MFMTCLLSVVSTCIDGSIAGRQAQDITTHDRFNYSPFRLFRCIVHSRDSAVSRVKEPGLLKQTTPLTSVPKPTRPLSTDETLRVCNNVYVIGHALVQRARVPPEAESTANLPVIHLHKLLSHATHPHGPTGVAGCRVAGRGARGRRPAAQDADGCVCP